MGRRTQGARAAARRSGSRTLWAARQAARTLRLRWQRVPRDGPSTLHRLTLEAAIGSVLGVPSVPSIRIAARGFHLPRNLEPVYRVPDNQILRLANDPRTPERGSIKVYTEGGV